MATGGSCGQYTQENEYFCRYFRLVNETGAKPLRKFIEQKAACRNMSIQAYLGTKRQKFCTLVQRNIIRQGQFDMIFPTQTAFDIHNLDITLLCCIMKTVCKLSPNGTTAMEDLREARNELCHNSRTEMEQSVFNARFSKVYKVIKQLLNEYCDKNFEAKIEQEMNIVKSDHLSAAQTVELIKTHTAQQKEVSVEMLTDRFEQLKGTLSKSIYDLKTEIKHVYETVEKQPNETRDELEKLLKTHKEDQASMPRIHPKIETLRKQTEVILNEVSNFVDTKQLHEVEDMLLSSGVVIITGGAGEGKTHTALEIMHRHGNAQNCLQINCPNDVSYIDPRIFEFVFIDDIFGNNDLDTSKFKSWFQVLEKLQQLVNARELKLIIATREIVLKECIQYLGKFIMFTKTTTLNSGKLSSSEKFEILSKALQKRKRSCSQETMQKCVSEFESDLGFPYMCFMFSSDEQFFQEGYLFFKRNCFMNSDIISQLTPNKQMSLLYLWMKGNEFPVILHRSEENDGILRQLIDIVKYDRDKDIDEIYNDIYTSLMVMDGVFVNARADGYLFAHNSSYQSCGFYLAHKGFFKEVIKYSALAFFMEQITISESVYRTDSVFVRNNLYQNIVDRVISEVIENDQVKKMADHPCLSQEILQVLIDTLRKRKQLKDFLLCGSSDKNKHKHMSFVAHYLETCATNSCWFLGQILSLVKCKRHFKQASKERDCRTYQIQLEACRGACRGGNLEAFKLVQTIKFDDSFLVDIATSGNTDMYRYVKDCLKYPCAEIIQCQALDKCVEKGDIKMYNTIRQYGCPVLTRCLWTAAKMKNAELLKLIIDDLGQSEALKVDVNVEHTLSTLFDIDVFETFLQNGICPSKDNMLCSLQDNYKLIETILWDTKYAVQCPTRQRMFDLRLALWFGLISDRFWREQLYSMGILETSKFLEKSVANGNTEQAEAIVQRLMNKNDWNPGGSYAINLLNTALSTNSQLYEFLLSCGIKPNVCTLYRAVMTRDLDLVKLTIAEMKKDRNFDPKSKSVKRAFLQSIFFFKIYEYFVSEGLQPTAYHYRFAVECQEDKAETLKVLHHVYSLTDNFGSLNKDVMGTTLLIALESEDIVRFFGGHNVKLPRNSLSLICCSSNLNIFRKAIDYLKCQNDWPSCNNIIAKSLQHAFYRPEFFEHLMLEIESAKICMPVSVFSILFAIRKKKFDHIGNYVTQMQENDLWNSNDIVLKVALLESIDDDDTSALFKRHGIRTDDVMEEAHALGNKWLESYIKTLMIQNSKEFVNPLSKYREPCSEHYLETAV